MAPRVSVLDRFRGPGWALVPIGSIVAVIFAIRYLSDTATALTYLALVAAAPGGGLPQLQSLGFGTASMGYGDTFVAAVLGAILATDRQLQLRAALLTLVLAGLFDLLFFVLNTLPATVPVAVVLILIE